MNKDKEIYKIERNKDVDTLIKIINLKEKLKVNDEIKSFNLAINGVWGSGKTTFINKFIEKIQENNEFKILNFNAWNIDYYDEPLEYFLDYIFGNEWTKTIAKDLFTSVCNLFKIHNKSLSKKINEIESNNKIHKLTKKTNNKEKETILFIVDDLDRCSSKFIVKLFELLKHFLNHERIICICLFNWEQANRSIDILHNNNYTNDSEFYLDKIFDYKWDLPCLSKIDILNTRFNFDEIYFFNEIDGWSYNRKNDFIQTISNLFPEKFSIREINRSVDEYKIGFELRNNRKNVFELECIIFCLIKNKIYNIVSIDTIIQIIKKNSFLIKELWNEFEIQINNNMFIIEFLFNFVWSTCRFLYNKKMELTNFEKWADFKNNKNNNSIQINNDNQEMQEYELKSNVILEIINKLLNEFR